ncbi:hypothetical protein Poli38472_011260 [Pythium oligandrum]|uniref:Uncharacterized protein n=1 Tax=Pythium oligandrum TaxID=41045 RepID=A0A8K1CRY5_PYTOL|nr:hypothetical protein Poli38472_011260 [Pythium oligandrum]|eukprot:TMW67640.1 hypothetical protein Poli38472_011260 [Pythium oligandrum]
MWMPDNAFEECAGHFWGIHGTRDYMRAKFAYLETMMALGTPTSLTEALKEGLDCLRLCRADNLGVREHVSAIYVRLGRLQEGYDFIKWWATCDPDGRYDWGDMSLPYLTIKNADMTESVSCFERAYSLPHFGALTFIKFYAAQSLSDLIGAETASEKLPGGLESAVSTFLPFSEAASKSKSTQKLREKVSAQAKKAFGMAHKHNKHYWKAMLHPDEFMNQPPPQYISQGSMVEARSAFEHIFPAWHATPGGLDFIRQNLQ